MNGILSAARLSNFLILDKKLRTLEKSAKIYVAGHRGMVGSSILRGLQSQGYQQIICKTSAELDLKNQQAVFDFFADEK